MTYTLDICGSQQIQDPGEADLSRAVLGLDTKQDDSFLILGPADMTYMQVGGDKDVGFIVEYQEGDTRHHYRAKRAMSAAEVVRALNSYRLGSDDWRRAVEWELVEI